MDWSTGLSDLNRLLGGFELGRLWVITGAPGSGKTTLLTQFVQVLATQHSFAVDFYTASSDSPEEIRERFVSLTCLRARRRRDKDAALDSLSPAAAAKLSLLRDADLNVHTEGGWSTGALWGRRDRVCLAIDEPEFNRPPVLALAGRKTLRQFADRPAIVLVTAPRSHCLEPGPHGDRIREEWAAVADVMIELVPVGDAGDVALRVFRNRQGPTGTISAVQQVHLARFVQSAVDGATDEESGR